ncbi:hypothetical protein [Actinotalea sp. Marseille-Q4924]|uniref:hypothetical protein n=1 Tax=Actinotalea sp. Marseille-Q4924 TaxID=2866571 RepID=UPI001CE4895B|nr:hypothetical protein [Actinotalea sp. Marseille-Q4924]
MTAAPAFAAPALAAPGPPQLPDAAPRTWDHAVSVQGGPRGEMAELAELVAAAVALDDAAEALRRATAAASRLAAMIEATWERSPGTAPRAASACGRLITPASGLPGCAHDVGRTAADVRTAVRGYVTADGAAERLVRAAQVAGGFAVGSAGPAGWLLATGAAAVGTVAVAQRVVMLRLLRRTPGPSGLLLNALSSWTGEVEGPAGLLGWLVVGDGPAPDVDPRDARVLESLLPFVGGFVRGALPGRGPAVRAPGGAGRASIAVSTAAELGLWLRRIRHLAGVTPSRLVVARSLDRPPAASQAAPRGVADLVGGIGRTYPRRPGGPGAADAGTVEVKELRRPDGTRTWVVTLPGTQEWGPLQRPNPFDLTSNLALMERAADDVTAAAVRAMELAGIPPGEPVVLAGHSQGGIAAASMAADPALQERFDVKAVVTVGSPVGHIALPPDVVGAHVEIATDLVPALDATPNPDGPHRTTVRVDAGRAPDAAVRAAALTPLGSHDVGTYAAVAAGLEVVDDPRWRAGSAPIEELLAGTTTVTTTWYAAARVPAPGAGVAPAVPSGAAPAGIAPAAALSPCACAPPAPRG